MKLGKYSFGIGDRFGRQSKAQLQAVMIAKDELGIDIVPVWNKSYREHLLIGSKPSDVNIHADEAVAALGYKGQYYVDADHINIATVKEFIPYCNYFTIDVADYINTKPHITELRDFLARNRKYTGELAVHGVSEKLNITNELLSRIGLTYLNAINKASEVYRLIKSSRENVVIELSMDEVDKPQSLIELFFVLSMIARYGIPVQTIAPRFTGGFFKGIDYVGNSDDFAREFEGYLHIIELAVKEFSLPDNLKLSIHSGSDKFSIYPVIGKLIKKYNRGVHIKTSGTTWLEEITGLAMSGKEGLQFATMVYEQGYKERHKYMSPYATVIDINEDKLPEPHEVNNWTATEFVETLRHVQTNIYYNKHFRQLMHISYIVAAQNMSDYNRLLKSNSKLIARQVMENIYERHIKRIFCSEDK